MKTETVSQRLATRTRTCTGDDTAHDLLGRERRLQFLDLAIVRLPKQTRDLNNFSVCKMDYDTAPCDGAKDPANTQRLVPQSNDADVGTAAH